MTTILGIQSRNGFTMAADSQATAGDRPYFNTLGPKIVKVGQLWIGAAGNGRACDIVSYNWNPPTIGKTEDPYKYLLLKGIPSMRSCLEKHGYVFKDEPKEGDDFNFLIGVNGKIFEVTGDCTVLVTTDKFFGVGSGGRYGIGAMAAGADIESAIKIASKYDVYTGGKIQIVRQGVNDA